MKIFKEFALISIAALFLAVVQLLSMIYIANIEPSETTGFLMGWIAFVHAQLLVETK